MLFSPEPATSLSYSLEESIRHYIKSFATFLGRVGTHVHRTTFPSGLQTPNGWPREMWYATPPSPLPVHCLSPRIWILEISGLVSWLLEAEWISWQENKQVSVWQTQNCWNRSRVLMELFANQAILANSFFHLDK